MRGGGFDIHEQVTMPIPIKYIKYILCVWIAGINGFLYGNLPGLSMCQGNKIHWHMFALGNEVTTVLLLLLLLSY